jgi:hypothetical protein
MISEMRNHFKMKAFPQHLLKCGKELKERTICAGNVTFGICIFEQ